MNEQQMYMGDFENMWLNKRPNQIENAMVFGHYITLKPYFRRIL